MAAKSTVLPARAAMTVVSTVAVTVAAALALDLPPSPDVLGVLAQATTAGFLFAAPSHWMGMGGPEAVADITALQLAATPVVAAAAVVATRVWWERAETR